MYNNFGNKIKELRSANKLTLDDLGRITGVTKQTIHSYEKNQKFPGSGTLLKLSNALDVHPSYFFSLDKEEEISISNIKFRQEDAIANHNYKLEEIKNSCKDYLMRLLEVHRLLNLEETFENPLKDTEINNKKDVEKAAKTIRRKWRLGYAPIANVCEVIENNKISVIEVNIENDFTGLCGRANDEIPFIVINGNIDDLARKRFTLLHELAHHVLEFADALTNLEVEKLCDHFAGAVLLVDDTLLHELGKNRTTISLNELNRIKEKYGMSIQAIIMRAYLTNIISYNTYCEWWQSYNEWRQTGLLSKSYKERYKDNEHPSKLDNLLIRGYKEQRIAKDKAAELKKMKIDVFEKFYEQLEFKMG